MSVTHSSLGAAARKSCVPSSRSGRFAGAGGAVEAEGAQDAAEVEAVDAGLVDRLRRLAREIFHQAGLKTQVMDIPSAAYPTPAQRPQNSRLDCSTLETVFGVARPDWRKSLHKVLKELGEI